MRQVQQVSHSSFTALPSAFLSACCTPPPTPPPPRPLQHSSSPFSNGNGTEPRWSSSARSELSLLRREFMDGHAEFLRFGPARIENFSLWPNHFGHSLSSLPQYTAGLWLLLLCIMEKKIQLCPLSSPPLHLMLDKTHWWYVGMVAWLAC